MAGGSGSPNRPALAFAFAALLIALVVPVAVAGSDDAQPAAKTAKKLKKLSKQVKRLKKGLRAVKTRASAGEKRLDEAESALGSADGRLDATESQISTLANQLGTLDGSLTTLTGRTDGLDAAMAALTSRLDQVEAGAAQIQSGETVFGSIGLAAEFSNNGSVMLVDESLPRPAPVNLGTSTVHVDGLDETGGVCTGTKDAPTAPPGHLCVYPAGAPVNATSFSATGNSRSGFTVTWETTGAGGLIKVSGFAGRWAYTAP